MKEIKTLYIDSEELEDVLIKLQDSFKFQFLEGEVENLITIDQLSNKVISRLNFKEGKECTSQIVFYKLRKHLSGKFKLSGKELCPMTRLKELFPKRERKQLWNKAFMDFYTEIPRLTPPPYLILTLLLSYLASVIILFAHSFIFGLMLFATTWIAWKLSIQFGNSFPADNLGELAGMVSSENYIDSRKHLNSINIPEIKRLILGMIADWQPEEDKELITMKTRLDYVG